MFQLIKNDGTIVESFTTKSSAKVGLFKHYCCEELPRLAKILELKDFKDMVKIDMETANQDGFIEDYMRIEEI